MPRSIWLFSEEKQLARRLGGEYATAVHRGPFDRLAETYAWLALDFMPREGRSMRKAPCVEIYLTPPERTPPAELLTEVLVPVR